MIATNENSIIENIIYSQSIDFGGISLKDNKKNLLIVAGIFLVLIIIVILLGIKSSVKKIPDDTIGNTAGNLNNGGLFCEYNGKVYFSNAYDGGTLYVMNSDETNVKKLNDSVVSYINASPSYLVYYQSSVYTKDKLSSAVQNYGIYRTDLKGKNADCIDDNVCTALVLAGNHLYYQHFDTKKYTTLYKSDLAGKHMSEVEKAIINPHAVSQGKIYFNGTSGDHYLYALNLNDDKISTVWPGNVWNPVVLGNFVYYMDLSNHYGLSRYSLVTGEVEILTHDRVDHFNVYDNMIYYQTAGKSNQALKRMRIDGSNNEIVHEGIHEHIHITSGYVYFNEFSLEVPVYHVPLYGGNVSIFEPNK